MLKRGFDAIVAGAALVVLALPMTLIACLVWIKLGRPILFRQERPGRHSRPFHLIKFRTMTGERDPHGELLPFEARLTRFGQLLRTTSLDELPELWNVLRGDMSLVGPRPLRMHYLPLYTERQARRHEVRPGITGWAQVNGRNSITWDEKFELDVWYVDHRSFLLDLKILAMTALKVVEREGIDIAGSPETRPFRGSSSEPAGGAAAKPANVTATAEP